jgi:hypothetical protein
MPSQVAIVVEQSGATKEDAEEDAYKKDIAWLWKEVAE